MRGSLRIKPYSIGVMLAALMGRLTVAAQDWRTVDDFALAGGNAEARGVAVDAAGRVYVVGTANGHAIVRSSSDGGTTWSTRDDFLYPSITNNVFNAITIDPQGDLFVGGASGGHWIVRRSTDQGVSWETVDDYYRPMNGPSNPGTNGVVYSLSSDRQGRVYGAGPMLRTGPSYPYWWVRGSGIGGTNWDTKLLIFSGYGLVSQITWAAEDVYVTGTADGMPAIGAILRSSDYGATWSTNFEATNEFYEAITSDSFGNVYSAGNRRNSNSVDLLVRKLTPGGTNWATLDRSTYSGSNGYGVDQANPYSIAVDVTGNICVAGQFVQNWAISATNGTTYGGNQIWYTRQYSAVSGEGSTTDFFSYWTNTYGTDMHTVAMGTAIAPDGSTFVVGYGATESGQHRWVVRKQSAFTPPPRLQIAVAGGSMAVSWPAAYTNSILEWTDACATNQLWQTFAGTVCVTNGRNMATLELASGARFFRLKSAAGQ